MLNTVFVTLAILMSASVHAGQVIKPDPQLTYGDLCKTDDPDFVDRRYSEMVPYCVRKVTITQKARIYDSYGIPERCRRYYTIDHFIPLALGGSNQTVNLWPEHIYVKATRRFLEQHLFDQLRRGEISQNLAMQTIVDAKMNPATPKPWKCGTSDNSDDDSDDADIGPGENQDQN